MWSRTRRGVKSGSVLARRWLWSSSETSKKFAVVWGNGDHGRLGLRGLESRLTPVPLPSSAFAGHGVQSIACGGAHTLFLSENGCVYATGLNDFGQLGLSRDTPYITAPTEVPGLPADIVHISAGYYHSGAIAGNGELYMWGNNSSGQLGLGKKAPKAVSVPTKIESLTGINIRMAALGSEHAVALTDTGEVLSWGGGENGKLGHGHDASTFGFFKSTSEYSPRLVKKLEEIKVKHVAAGLLHSACVGEYGAVYLFGENLGDEAGFFGANSESIPSLINEVPYAEEVACGGYHTCVLTCGGELYTWGSNENGCLGTGTTSAFYSPERVKGPFLRTDVSQVSCGWKHTAAISQNSVFTWGWGGSNGTFSADGLSAGGQLGHGSDLDYMEPEIINVGENLRALQVSCGFNHTGAIFEHV